MARKRQEESGGEGSWLNTYADMITLVLTFFVALFSMSTLSQEVVDQMAEGQNAGRGEQQSSVPTESEIQEDLMNMDLENVEIEDMSDLAKVIQAYIEQNGLTSSLQVSEGPGAVYIRINSDVFFNPDSYHLRQENVETLKFLGECFKQVEEQLLMINLYGHTASVQANDYPVSALMLSAERAANVAIYFEEESKISSALLTPIGQGNSYPIADNATAEGRRQNRRVEIAVISNKATIMDTEDVLRLLRGAFDESVYPKEGGVKDLLTDDYMDTGAGQTSPEPETVPEPDGAPEPGTVPEPDGAPEPGTASEPKAPAETAPEGTPEGATE